jgi:hypothetical protein
MTLVGVTIHIVVEGDYSALVSSLTLPYSCGQARILSNRDACLTLVSVIEFGP